MEIKGLQRAPNRMSNCTEGRGAAILLPDTGPIVLTGINLPNA